MSKDNGSNGTRRTGFEFTLELDLHLFFTPLMQNWGDGIMMTRTIQLPFPPDDKTTIGGRSIEGDCKPPLGYQRFILHALSHQFRVSKRFGSFRPADRICGRKLKK